MEREMAPSGMQAADDRALWAETRQWLVRLAALVRGWSTV